METILGGIVIAIVSGLIGKSIGSFNNVKSPLCMERQQSCQKVLIEKIDNLKHELENLTKAVNNKLFGI
jgi:hypothetical protein